MASLFQSNRPLDRHLERLREKEQRDQEGEARALLERESGRFHVEGESVEQFTLEQLQMYHSIGKGAYTEMVKQTIYKPRNLPIAVKIIHIIDLPSGNNRGRGEDNMIREAENARRAANENVVWLFGFIVHEKTCYMCMELMHANLDEVKKVAHDLDGLNIGRKMGNAEIEQFLGCVTVAVVDGLAFLRNNARVMHRDIKPNNIMINDHGQVKICDFGVSKRLSTGISSSRAYTQGAGCIAYMAPEQLTLIVSETGYGSKSGVWSLGISLHECATGKLAYDGRLDFVLAEMIVQGDPPRIPLNVGLSNDLRNFVDACLFKDESGRASLIPTPEGNRLQNKKFYMHHLNRGAEARKINVIEVLQLVTPHLTELRRNLD